MSKQEDDKVLLEKIEELERRVKALERDKTRKKRLKQLGLKDPK